MERGLIFDIERYSTADGPGIRTVVFFKGCNLHCYWCHNPESLKVFPEVDRYEQECIHCGRCVQVCPERCHVFTETGRVFHSEKCIHCMACTEACPVAALRPIGKWLSVEDCMAQIREDEYFGSLIADDLKGILRDIRNEHRPDTMTADEVSLAATVQGQLQDAMNFEGSSEEKQVRSFLATFGIDYDKLTKEQFVSLIEILKLSKYLKSPINQRGKARPQLQHGKGKKKRR